MLHLIDRFFIKKPLVRRFVTKLVAGNRERKVTLLAGDYVVHTVREHGLFRASKLARTCSLFRDELPVLIHLAGLLRDGDTFLDIGANVGVFAANIAGFRVLFPGLRVYAFEPNPDTAARLRANAGGWASRYLTSRFRIGMARSSLWTARCPTFSRQSRMRHPIPSRASAESVNAGVWKTWPSKVIRL